MSTTPTTVQALIYEVLNAHLATLVSPSLIAFSGIDFEVPDDRAYVRVDLMPNINQRITIDSDGPHRYLGIYQIMVVRKAAVGIVGAQEAAGLLAAQFPADLKLWSGALSVRIMEDPSVAMSMPDGADLLTPVSVQYETFF